MHQSSSLDFKLVQRVCLLQQALDQALDALQDLRSQVQDKQWIEDQLANTEKYANVQKQAIAHLKQHLGQFTEVQQHLLAVTAYRLNEMIDHQQTEFNRLRLQIQQGQVEIQTYLQYLGSHCQSENRLQGYHTDLEAEVMIARTMTVSLSRQINLAKQHLDTLTSDLSNHHLSLSQIIKTIQSMMDDLTSFESTTGKSTPSTVSITEVQTTEPDYADADILQDTLRRQELRIQELETMLMQQFEERAQLKQRYQALAVEKDHYKRQLEALQEAQTPPTSPPPVETAVPDNVIEPSLLVQQSAHYRLRSQPPPPIQPLKLRED
ncbi:MAG: hypothetical protein AAFY20_15335 [Cyanobacteria bacterium J06639_14]